MASGSVRSRGTAYTLCDGSERTRTLPFAIEDASSPRKDFDGIGPLRERFARIERAVQHLNVVQTPHQVRGRQQTGVEDDLRPHGETRANVR